MSPPPPADDDAALMALCRAIAQPDPDEVARQLDARPSLATLALETGATRQAPEAFYLDRVGQHLYAGTTALHIAAAAYQRDTIHRLIELGADVRARNRRGAEPLHLASVGAPGGRGWDPPAQCEVIRHLVAAGADPDAPDKSGVAPLHRAVRARCAGAVATLLEAGADPRRGNGSGSTPLHLAVQPTGRGDTGSEVAREQQRAIIVLLLEHGALPTDTNAKGRTVEESAVGEWVQDLLRTSA